MPAVDTPDGLYAYGLVDTLPHSLDVPGIDQQHPIYPVVDQGMCVLVSRIDINTFQSQVRELFAALNRADESARSGIARVLRLHEGVVEHLRQQSTVVPFKFGTILKDEGAVSQLLRDCAEQFHRLLCKFAGKAEWGLKVYADRQAMVRHLTGRVLQDQRQDERQAPSQGMAYLQRKKIEEEAKETVRAQLATISETIVEQLGAYACETRLNELLPRTLTGQEMLLNAVYLLPDTHAAHFCQQGAALRETYAALGLELDISGPWSPYSFTENWD